MNAYQFYKYLLKFDSDANYKHLCPNNAVKKPVFLLNLIVEFKKHNFIISTLKKLNFKQLKYTNSGAIAANQIASYSGGYDLVVSKIGEVFRGSIITITLFDRIWKFFFGNWSNEEHKSGYAAYRAFMRECTKENITLNDYAVSVDEGKAIKETINSPSIKFFGDSSLFYDHVHHIDLVSAYASAIMDRYPEFKPVFAKLSKFEKNAAIGFFQSKFCQFKFAHLAKIAINTTREIIDNLCDTLLEQGYELLATNTDGIWYYDPTGRMRMYHDANEGHAYGKWHHDHVDVKWHGISPGAYMYIEKGKLKPVVRGWTIIDSIKPRDQWTLDDWAMYESVRQPRIIYNEIDNTIEIGGIN